MVSVASDAFLATIAASEVFRGAAYAASEVLRDPVSAVSSGVAYGCTTAAPDAISEVFLESGC